MDKKIIQRYEWRKLTLNDGEELFGVSQLEALQKFHNTHGGKYFSLIRKGVSFKNYVGVIQVGNITIEILPKADKEDDKTLWRNILLDMLRECDWMQVDANDYASLKLKHHSILDAYFEIFLFKCNQLLHEGLVKKYRTVEQNSSSLKGKLLLTKQIQANAVHQERFYTAHTVYDSNNIFNRILLKAIRLISKLSSSTSIQDKVGRLLLDWPEVVDLQVNEDTFNRLHFDRKTERYREAISIAKMLLSNYRPDISGGKNHVLAVLFDMNELWEEFIYRRLKKAATKTVDATLNVNRQKAKTFWECTSSDFRKTVRLDIIFERNGEKAILDTKWKTFENYRAIDDELKQMYVYGQLWTANKCLLVFPSNSFDECDYYQTGMFHMAAGKTTRLSNMQCDWLAVNVLSGNKAGLNSAIGQSILQKI